MEYCANPNACVTHKYRRRCMCDANENGETGYGHLESLASDLTREPTFLSKSGPSDSSYCGDLVLTVGELWPDFRQVPSLSNVEARGRSWSWIAERWR